MLLFLFLDTLAASCICHATYDVHNESHNSLPMYISCSGVNGGCNEGDNWIKQLDILLDKIRQLVHDGINDGDDGINEGEAG